MNKGEWLYMDTLSSRGHAECQAKHREAVVDVPRPPLLLPKFVLRLDKIRCIQMFISVGIFSTTQVS
jgi:hypothetical protein